MATLSDPEAANVTAYGCEPWVVVSGLAVAPENAVVTRDGDYLIDRSGDFIQGRD